MARSPHSVRALLREVVPEFRFSLGDRPFPTFVPQSLLFRGDVLKIQSQSRSTNFSSSSDGGWTEDAEDASKNMTDSAETVDNGIVESAQSSKDTIGAAEETPIALELGLATGFVAGGILSHFFTGVALSFSGAFSVGDCIKTTHEYSTVEVGTMLEAVGIINGARTPFHWNG